MNDQNVSAQIAFQRIFNKLKISQRSAEFFFDHVIWPMAPLDYISTHYNLSKELQAFRPPIGKSYSFDSNQNWEAVDEPISFFNDVEINGNLSIGNYQKVFVDGNLSVSGVISLESESRLFVAGRVTTSGIRVEGPGNLGTPEDSNLLDIALLCLEIEASEMLISRRHSYAASVKTKMLVVDGSYADLDIRYTIQDEEPMIQKVALDASHRYLLSGSNRAVRLFRSDIFENGSGIDDPVNHAFETLIRINSFLDENYVPVSKEWIWK